MVDNSKQGIEIIGCKAIKRHQSVEKAQLEMDVARMYRDNSARQVSIISYEMVPQEDGSVLLEMPLLTGKSAMGTGDKSLMKNLVLDLAVFHEVFAQSPNSASVIYRDAIPSNYIISDNGGYTHVDFSSSQKYVHCLDDLALLTHPLWSKNTKSDAETLMEDYIAYRNEISSKNISRANELDAQIPRIDSNALLSYYIKTIKSMATEENGAKELLERIKDVEFSHIQIEDFQFFFDFRTVRGQCYLKQWGK